MNWNLVRKIKDGDESSPEIALLAEAILTLHGMMLEWHGFNTDVRVVYPEFPELGKPQA